MSEILETPRSLGYRLPAEWEPHAATWLSWPHNLDTWPGNFGPIPDVWSRLVRALADSEPIHVLAGGEETMAAARRLVEDVPGVTLHDIATNDCWARDHGPMFLSAPRGQTPALIDWQYNAWGGKYPPFDLDNAVPAKVAEMTGRRRFQPGIVLEGGAIDSNGLGTVLTTEECLLHENRNGGLSRAAMEEYLTDYCGARHVLWLGQGIAGDDTDGHIDELARFVGPRTVVAARESDSGDVNYRSLEENFRRLESFTDQDGRPLEVIALPMPAAKYHEDHRLPASYCNFYIANRVVIVPQFDDPADVLALDILRRQFSDRQVVGHRAVDLVWGLGAYHCITQQEPV